MATTPASERGRVVAAVLRTSGPPWPRVRHLSHFCGPELIDRVLAKHGRAEQRCRLLPARLVVNAILLVCLKPTASYQKYRIHRRGQSTMDRQNGQVFVSTTDGLAAAMPYAAIAVAMLSTASAPEPAQRKEIASTNGTRSAIGRQRALGGRRCPPPNPATAISAGVERR
jgi:Insertion element 4 transposase N-terminal